MARPNYPDLVALKKIEGSITVPLVPAGGTEDAVIEVEDKYFIVGVPEVVANVGEAILINGGKNKFAVRVSNPATAAQDIVVNYTVYVIS